MDGTVCELKENKVEIGEQKTLQMWSYGILRSSVFICFIHSHSEGSTEGVQLSFSICNYVYAANDKPRSFIRGNFMELESGFQCNLFF